MIEGLRTGSVVRSAAGRDKGRVSVVYSILSDRAVTVVDGGMRKIDSPKRKNILHIRDTGIVLEELARAFAEKDRVYDAEVRKALKAAGFEL